jgi:hypothetical protein
MLKNDFTLTKWQKSQQKITPKPQISSFSSNSVNLYHTLSFEGLELMFGIAEYFTKNNQCSKIDFTLSKWQIMSKEITPKNQK